MSNLMKYMSVIALELDKLHISYLVRGTSMLIANIYSII